MTRFFRAGKYVYPVFVAAVAVLTRFWIALNMRPIVHTDSITFLFLGELDTVRTPGYPLFIESLLMLNDLIPMTTDYFLLIAYGQLFILGVLNSYLIYRLADRLTGHRPFAALMGILFNFNYLIVGFEFQIMTETLSLTLLLALLALTVDLFRGRKSSAFLAGVLSVLLIYTKATFVLFFAAVPVLVFAGFFPQSKNKDFIRKIAPALAVFLAVNAVGITAWSLRNKAAYGYFGISTLMPYQLRYYTSHLFERYPPSGDPRLDRVAEVYAEEFAATGWLSSTVSNFHLRLADEMGLTDAEISRLFMKANVRLIRTYPGEYIKRLPRAFLSYYRLYAPYWTARNNRALFFSRGILPSLYRGFFTFYQRLFSTTWGLALLLVGAPLVLFIGTFRRKERFYGWLLIMAAIHYNGFVSILSTDAGINNLRYRIPVEPLLLLSFYAAVFLLGHCALDSVRKRRRRNPKSRDSEPIATEPDR